jgi:hypothetical protein
MIPVALLAWLYLEGRDGRIVRVRVVRIGIGVVRVTIGIVVRVVGIVIRKAEGPAERNPRTAMVKMASW